LAIRHEIAKSARYKVLATNALNVMTGASHDDTLTLAVSWPSPSARPRGGELTVDHHEHVDRVERSDAAEVPRAERQPQASLHRTILHPGSPVSDSQPPCHVVRRLPECRRPDPTRSHLQRPLLSPWDALETLQGSCLLKVTLCARAKQLFVWDGISVIIQAPVNMAAPRRGGIQRAMNVGQLSQGRLLRFSTPKAPGGISCHIGARSVPSSTGYLLN
jgi:hypothetical protein